MSRPKQPKRKAAILKAAAAAGKTKGAKRKAARLPEVGEDETEVKTDKKETATSMPKRKRGGDVNIENIKERLVAAVAADMDLEEVKKANRWAQRAERKAAGLTAPLPGIDLEEVKKANKRAKLAERKAFKLAKAAARGIDPKKVEKAKRAEREAATLAAEAAACIDLKEVEKAEQAERKNARLLAAAKKKNRQVLYWETPRDYVPYESEEAIVDVLMHFGRNERGMMKDQPAFRLKAIREKIDEVEGITLHQALSLRRHHIRKLNPRLPFERLQLGSGKDVRRSAAIFEESVASFLSSTFPQVKFWNEKEQRKRSNNLKCTPDFLLKNPILLEKVRTTVEKQTVLEERVIHWIEAKMFYGASTIDHGDAGAVGSIRNQAQKYVDEFGAGAIVFMNGCGERLAADLYRMNVSVLDCHSLNTPSLRLVRKHQKTWCANHKGQILN